MPAGAQADEARRALRRLAAAVHPDASAPDPLPPSAAPRTRSFRRWSGRRTACDTARRAGRPCGGCEGREDAGGASFPRWSSRPVRPAFSHGERQLHAALRGDRIAVVPIHADPVIVELRPSAIATMRRRGVAGVRAGPVVLESNELTLGALGRHWTPQTAKHPPVARPRDIGTVRRAAADPLPSDGRRLPDIGVLQRRRTRVPVTAAPNVGVVLGRSERDSAPHPSLRRSVAAGGAGARQPEPWILRRRSVAIAGRARIAEADLALPAAGQAHRQDDEAGGATPHSATTGRACGSNRTRLPDCARISCSDT